MDKYLDLQGIKEEFGKHLVKHRGYSPEEVAVAVSDFPDPYSNCYLEEDFLERVEIDGVQYEKYTVRTHLWRCGMPPKTPDFFFYTYYKSEDVKGRTVGDYMRAFKLYQVEGVNKKDFR